MKKRDITELHTKTVEELRAQLKELKTSVGAGRLDLAQQKLTNTTSLRNMRTDIARILTVLEIKASSSPSINAGQEGSKA